MSAPPRDPGRAWQAVAWQAVGCLCWRACYQVLATGGTWDKHARVIFKPPLGISGGRRVPLERQKTHVHNGRKKGLSHLTLSRAPPPCARRTFQVEAGGGALCPCDRMSTACSAAPQEPWRTFDQCQRRPGSNKYLAVLQRVSQAGECGSRASVSECSCARPQRRRGCALRRPRLDAPRTLQKAVPGPCVSTSTGWTLWGAAGRGLASKHGNQEDPR